MRSLGSTGGINDHRVVKAHAAVARANASGIGIAAAMAALEKALAARELTKERKLAASTSLVE